jgi:hypothetical protein
MAKDNPELYQKGGFRRGREMIGALVTDEDYFLHWLALVPVGDARRDIVLKSFGQIARLQCNTGWEKKTILQEIECRPIPRHPAPLNVSPDALTQVGDYMSEVASSTSAEYTRLENRRIAHEMPKILLSQLAVDAEIKM